MSWWFGIYLGLYAVLSAAGLRDDYRDRRPAWFLASAIASNLTVAFFFIAFWQPSFCAPLGLAAPLAFIAAMCWEWFQTAQDIRRLCAEPGLSAPQQRLIAIISTLFSLTICLPAFAVAGISAFSFRV